MAGNRRGKEFSEDTKRFVYYKQKGKCAVCDEELGKDVEFHHKIPIFAFRKYFPSFSVWFIKSVANCEAVHEGCHNEVHKETDNDLVFYSTLLRELLKYGNTLSLL